MSAVDLFGPANAPGAVNTRPPETRTFGTVDSFFKDCSSAALDDGTEFQAAWFNQMVAVARALARGNGQTASGADIVQQDNTNDLILLRAIQHLIQRGQVLAGIDTGVANAVVVSLSPAPPEYKQSMVVRVLIAANNTGPATINVNGLGVKNILSSNLGALGANAMSAGMFAELIYDGAQFQLIGTQPNVLTAPRTYYVNAAAGSDANDGLAAAVGGGHGPFATLQKALNMSQTFNLNGFNITIRIADGSYTSATPTICPIINGSGLIYLTGNVAAPLNVDCKSTSGSAFYVYGNGYVFDGLAVSASNSFPGDGGHGIWVFGTATINAVNFKTCVGGHLVTSLGTVNVNGPIAISGNASMWANIDGGAVILNGVNLPSLALSGPNFSAAFANMFGGGLWQGRFGTITGAASGVRYTVNANSILDTGGMGISYLPGTVAGSQSSGGQYL